MIQPLIRKTEMGDIDQIVSIAKHNELKDAYYKEIQTRGFLVSRFSEANYRNYVIDNEHFYVLEDRGVIRAFILIFKENELDYKSIVNAKIKDYTQRNFIVVKQICVEAESRRKGYGRKLYEYIAKLIKQDILAAIVLEPMNIASIEFHKKLGYTSEFKITPEDGLTRGIFMLSNHQN